MLMFHALLLLASHFFMHLLPSACFFALNIHLFLVFGFILLLPDHLVNHLSLDLLLIGLVVKHLLGLHLFLLGITDILSHFVTMGRLVVLYLLPLLRPFGFMEHCHLLFF